MLYMHNLDLEESIKKIFTKHYLANHPRRSNKKDHPTQGRLVTKITHAGM